MSANTQNNPNESTQQQFLWSTHEYLAEYARFADTKAAFSATLAAAFIGVIYSAKLQNPPANANSWGILSAMGGIFLLVVSVGISVAVVLPRLTGSNRSGFIFWGAIIRHGDLQTFKSEFYSLTDQRLNDELLAQIYIVSKILEQKYLRVRWSLIFFAAGGVCCVAGLLL